jgi:serine/threonine protein kinase
MKPSNILILSEPVASTTSSDAINYNVRKKRDRYPSGSVILKASDLVSCIEKGSRFETGTLSCTAKFVAPEIARLIEKNENYIASSSQGIWSLGLSIIQMIDPRYEGFFPSIDLPSAADIYRFYQQTEDSDIQKMLDLHIEKVLQRLITSLEETAYDFTEISAVLVNWRSLISQMLRVNPSQRFSFEDNSLYTV